MKEGRKEGRKEERKERNDKKEEHTSLSTLPPSFPRKKCRDILIENRGIFFLSLSHKQLLSMSHYDRSMCSYRNACT
jgi:hypothetical protein